MMGLGSGLASALDSVLVGTLVGPLFDISLKATVLLGLALVVVHRVPGARAALRLRLLQVALVGTIALLPLGALLPSWSWSLAPDPLGRAAGRLPQRAQLQQPDATSPLMSGESSLDRGVVFDRSVGAFARADDAERVESQVGGRWASKDLALRPGSSRLPTTWFRGALQSSTTWIALAWILGTLWSLRRQFLAHRLLAEVERDATIELNPSTLEGVEWAAKTLGVQQPVRLLVGDCASPMTWGHTDPVIMLPNHHQRWSDERRRVVLLHELAHVRHGDWLFRVLARTVCALYWFHPLAWMALSRLILEQEHACDEAVMSLGTSPSCYAQHLLSLARDENVIALPIPLPALPMARRPQLEERLMSILRFSHHKSPVRNGALALTAVLALTVLVPVLAAVEPWTKEPQPAEPSGEIQQAPLARVQALQKLTEVARHLRQLEQKLEPYETRLEKIEAEMQPREELVASVEGSLKPYEEKLEAIDGDMEPFEAELVAIQARLEPHEAQLEGVGMGLEPIEQKLEGLEMQLEPFERQLAELESKLEPFEVRLKEAAGGSKEQIHAQMQPLFSEMKRVHEQMEPVRQGMQAVRQEMEPLHQKMSEIHHQMEPVLAEMKVVHERMQPMHDRMRKVHHEMEPVMEPMRQLQMDIEPLHARMKKIHLEMAPLHAEMKGLSEEFEKRSQVLMDAILREELASLSITDETLTAVRNALDGTLFLNINNNRWQFVGSLSEVRSTLRLALQKGGVTTEDLDAVSDTAARALLGFDVGADY